MGEQNSGAILSGWFWDRVGVRACVRMCVPEYSAGCVCIKLYICWCMYSSCVVFICIVPPDNIPLHTFTPYHTYYSSKTPGGRLVYLYTKKRGSVPRCGDCGNKLRGVSCQRDVPWNVTLYCVLLCIPWSSPHAVLNHWLDLLKSQFQIRQKPSFLAITRTSLIWKC